MIKLVQIQLAIYEEISLGGKSRITVNVRFKGLDGDDRSEIGIGYGKMKGICTLKSYSVDTASDSVIARGTAGFIAVDPNSCPYTIVK